MKPFPGTIKDTKVGLMLNGNQINWLYKEFPINTNKAVCEAMGITRYQLKKFLRTFDDLKKDEDWKYVERSKHINKGPHGCAVVHDVTIQTKSITVATKLSRKDYEVLCEKARNADVTKYRYLKDIIRKGLNLWK